jgi:hypothetical protein
MATPTDVPPEEFEVVDPRAAVGLIRILAARFRETA